jgi:hypothetical protein
MYVKTKTTKAAHSNKPRKTNYKRNNRTDRTGVNVPVRPNDIMPPKLIKTLNYIDSAYVRNNPANNFLVYSFRINDLFDPDPLILSGSISGFKEIMQFYSYYRVQKIDVSFKIFNNENFAILYGAVFSQSNLTGVIGTRDDAINALENDFSTRARLLSAKGGMDHEDIHFGLPVWQLLGEKKQYEAEQSYTGLGLATPAQPLWLNFIVASPTGTALTNGYTNSTTLSMTSEFFGRTNLRA